MEWYWIVLITVVAMQLVNTVFMFLNVAVLERDDDYLLYMRWTCLIPWLLIHPFLYLYRRKKQKERVEMWRVRLKEEREGVLPVYETCELAEAVANNGGRVPVCNLDLLDEEWLGKGTV
jgi:hypothetical protein